MAGGYLELDCFYRERITSRLRQGRKLCLMVLVDTSVWIDYFRGVICEKTNLLDRLFDSERIVSGDLIIAELMQGLVSNYYTMIKISYLL